MKIQRTNGLLLVAALVCLAGSCRAQLSPSAWPKFHANAQNTGLSAYGGPTSATVDWTFTSGAAVSSSPAVGPDGAVYFVSQDQYLYAINANGTQRWRYLVNSTSYSSPAVASDGTVYVGSDNYCLYAINSDGTHKWHTLLNKDIKASPTIGSDGVVYVGALNGKMYAVRPDGSIKWSYLTGGAITSSAALDSDGNIYFGSEDGYVYALNQSGVRLWRYRMSYWVDSSPAIDSAGLIYAADSYGKLVCLYHGGSLKWSYSIGATVRSSPAVAADGTIYVGADDDYIYAFSPDGTRKWRYATGGNVQSSPAVGNDGAVYVASFDGNLYALNPNGTLLWQYTMGGQVYSSPAISNEGALCIGAYDHKLYCFGRDKTPPTTPVVLDDGQFTSNSTTLHAAWSATDPQTGVAEYQYAIGTAAGGVDVVGWTSVGTATEATKAGLALVNGTTYFFSVKARNGVDLWSSVGASDGITLDTTPPLAPTVVDDGVFTASADTLHATWSAVDPQSGVAEYQYRIGTSPGAGNVVDWTSVGAATEVTKAGLSLSDHTTYYFTVNAKNGAGLWGPTGSSDGITTDQTPPTVPTVVDDGQYTWNNTSLHAVWSSSDAQSGVAEYQYAIGTTVGGTQTVGWTSVGSATQVLKAGLSLADGTTYYFSVKAKNTVGLWSNPGTSDGIIVDAGAPATPTVIDDGGYTASMDTLHAVWAATDPQSGIAEYQYAIGTTPGGADTVGWTSMGSVTEVTKSGLSLTGGTTYYFSVTARNGAGVWSAVGVSNGIIPDWTSPPPPSVVDDGQYTSSSTTLHAAWTAADAESGIAEYQYAIGTTAGGTQVVTWTSVGTATEITKSGLTLSDGVAYYFAVKAKNRAGLWSNAGTSDGIVEDHSAPTPPTVTDDGDYTSSPDTLHASWIATDPHSGIAEYQYAIGTTPGGTQTVGWTSVGTATEATRSGLSLTNNTTYYFTVKAKNGSGLWGPTASSNGIVTDFTPPSVPVVVDDGQYTSNNASLHATWSSSDAQSGIAEYQYAIGTTPGGTQTVVWTSVGTATSVTSSGLSLVDGTTYYFAVKAKNRAGSWSGVGTSDGILLDTTPPLPPAVVDDGDFTSSTNTLHATWGSSDPQSGVVEYQYRIGSSLGAGDVVDWTSVGTATGVTKAGLSLLDQRTYYFTVKAKNGAGLWGPTGSSDGIFTDFTPPSVPTVIDDGLYTSSNTLLHATWSSSDAQSGVAEYQYAIGTTAGGTQTVPWTSVGTATEVARNGLSLIDGITYYFAVKAANRAGLWSNVGTSDGITVDTSIPPAPVVMDDGDFTSSTNTLHASWGASDPLSGIVEYQYAIGTSAGGTDTVTWTSVGTATEVTRAGLSLLDQRTYYFTVKAKNGAGLWGPAGSSDGITTDFTPPSVPAVVDDGQYTSINTSLHAVWSSADAHSGVAEYQYAIGTTAGGTQVVTWTSVGTATEITKSGLTLSDGVAYYFAVKARNRAGLWSNVGTSDGIVVDHSAPLAPTVTDDGDYTSSADTLHATWIATDPHSGIAEYQYAIGTTPGGTQTVGWTSVGTATEATRSGLVLTNNTTYYFTVKAKNGSGLWGPTASSDGIITDFTPPSVPVVVDDGQYTSINTSLHATWSSSDAQSGISEYQYAIGTTPGGTQTVGWTSVGAATSVTSPGLSLVDGTTYYFAVKSKNRAGMWSSVGMSDGIMVDASAPVTPTVTDDGTYQIPMDSLHAAWTSADPQSGIVEYQYAIGTTAGGIDTVGWTSVGLVTEITKSGLSLAGGGIYYFAVKAKNGANLWSIVGTSDGIIVEGTPPTTPVVIDDGQYTSSATSLHAIWSATDPESGVVEYQYAIGTTSGGAQIVGWTPVGTATEMTKTGLSLADGVIYYFAVKAKNLANMWSVVGVSDGIMIETSPPSAPAVNDDGEYTSSFEMLHAIWGASDPQSGIAEYQYAIGTSPGTADIASWSSAGAATEVSRAGLSLYDGSTYYFAVKAKNGAGLWGPMGVSDGITVATISAWPKFRGGPKNQGTSNLMGSAVGALLWEYPTEGWVESSPAMSGDGTAYIGSGDGSLYAISRNGTVLWNYQAGDAIDSSPAIGKNGALVFGSADTYIYCLAASGRLNWRYKTGGMVRSSPVIGPDDTIYVGSYDSYVYAVRWDGTLKWRYLVGGPVWSSPALSDDGIIYFGCGDGFIYALYAATGGLKWRHPTGTAVDSSPCVGPDGTVYSGSGDGYFYALNPDGGLKWTYYSGWPVDSSAAVAPDGTIYVGTGHDWSYGLLFALRPNGTLKWAFDAHGEVYSSPAVGADGVIYFGAGDGNVYAVNPDGSKKWSFQTGMAVLSSAGIGRNGTVCIGSYSGSIYSFRDSEIDDLTSPTRPTVTDEGVATDSTTRLAGAWASTDPESGIAEYMYAIGTWPGTDDVVRWTSAGVATSIVRSDLDLTVGVTYYVSVKARNNARMWSSVGASDGIVVVGTQSPVSIGAAKQQADGTHIYMTGKIMTGGFVDQFYMEEPDRSTGIKVLTNGLSMPWQGATLNLVGTVITDNGEKAIRLSTLEIHATAETIKPLGIAQRALCATSASVSKAEGLSCIGLLASTWGTVTAIGQGYFFIDDGSSVRDASGCKGLKVSLTGSPGNTIISPSVGDHLRVTGVLGVEWSGEDFRYLLRPRAQSDLSTF